MWSAAFTSGIAHLVMPKLHSTRSEHHPSCVDPPRLRRPRRGQCPLRLFDVPLRGLHRFPSPPAASPSPPSARSALFPAPPITVAVHIVIAAVVIVAVAARRGRRSRRWSGSWTGRSSTSRVAVVADAGLDLDVHIALRCVHRRSTGVRGAGRLPAAPAHSRPAQRRHSARRARCSPRATTISALAFMPGAQAVGLVNAHGHRVGRGAPPLVAALHGHTGDRAHSRSCPSRRQP